MVQRVMIRLDSNDRPVTLKMKLAEDIPQEGKFHNHLFPFEVVEIPDHLWEELKRSPSKVTRRILELVPDEAPTRPLFYTSMEEAKLNDPRYRSRFTPEQIRQQVAQLNAMNQNAELRRRVMAEKAGMEFQEDPKAAPPAAKPVEAEPLEAKPLEAKPLEAPSILEKAEEVAVPKRRGSKR